MNKRSIGAVLGPAIVAPLDDSLLGSDLAQDIGYNIYAAQIARMNHVEAQVRQRLVKARRLGLQEKSEPRAVSKFLRVFCRYEYVPGSMVFPEHDPTNPILEKAHFVVYVEGFLLDEVARKGGVKFGSFFDKFRIQVEKKIPNQNTQSIEFVPSDNPEMTNCDCYKFKIYSEKPINIKVLLYRSQDVKARFELSPKLRKILPYIRVDPTEEEVVQSLWQYVQSRDLWNRRNIKCDADLTDLFGCDALAVTDCQVKLASHLTPRRPVQVDMTLLTGPASAVAPSTSTAYSAVSALANGRNFDLEVDMFDDGAASYIEMCNETHNAEVALQGLVAESAPKLNFIAANIIKQYNRVKELEAASSSRAELVANELANAIKTGSDSSFISTLNSFKCKTTVQGVGAGGLPGLPGDILLGSDLGLLLSQQNRDKEQLPARACLGDHIIPSAMHLNRGYIDVGNDALFRDYSDKISKYSSLNIGIGQGMSIDTNSEALRAGEVKNEVGGMDIENKANNSENENENDDDTGSSYYGDGSDDGGSSVDDGSDAESDADADATEDIHDEEALPDDAPEDIPDDTAVDEESDGEGEDDEQYASDEEGEVAEDLAARNQGERNVDVLVEDDDVEHYNEEEDEEDEDD